MATSTRTNQSKPSASDYGTLRSIPDAAAYLAVSERWMRRAVAERRIPFIKCGRHVRFAQADLDAYIDSQRVPARGAA